MKHVLELSDAYNRELMNCQTHEICKELFMEKIILDQLAKKIKENKAAKHTKTSLNSNYKINLKTPLKWGRKRKRENLQINNSKIHSYSIN